MKSKLIINNRASILISQYSLWYWLLQAYIRHLQCFYKLNKPKVFIFSKRFCILRWGSIGLGWIESRKWGYDQVVELWKSIALIIALVWPGLMLMLKVTVDVKKLLLMFNCLCLRYCLDKRLPLMLKVTVDVYGYF